ncbi:MAG: ATP-binding protein [Euryarchaeota archaeon HGW-Euryarchaeota-1]|nr:MAG: ATP-binding protein [Euryarchaeota archaeon HGW-Euryarchaeota-1]
MNTSENLFDVEFFDRGKEKEEIMNVLTAKPQLLNFIYGPINTGKTTLIQKLIDDLPKDKYVVFYINLRGKLIKEYGGFVRVLFKVKRKEISEKVIEKGEKLAKKALVLAGRYLSGIPIEKDMLDGFLDAEGTEDVFEFLEEYFLKISQTKIPILIIDELQVIGDLEINGKAIYKLFNFFIRLTKELHICHVFALSSDSLFIERVYNEAMLYERANYILVDNFDEETTKKFLKKYGFSEEEQKITQEYCEGKASLLTVAITKKINGENIKNIKKYLEEWVVDAHGRINQRLYAIKNLWVEIKYEGATVKINYERTIEILKNFLNEESYVYSAITPEIYYLTSQNILFVDPRRNTIKPQSSLNLLAIREILREVEK